MCFWHDESLLDYLLSVLVASDIFKTNRWLFDEYTISQLRLQLGVVPITHFIEQIKTHETLVLLIILQPSDVIAFGRA